jgi:hypothetical protein
MKSCEIPAPTQPHLRRARRSRLEEIGNAVGDRAFVFCPCHLPITLASWRCCSAAATGVALRDHPFIAGTIVTLLWVAGTWRGLRWCVQLGSMPLRTVERFERGTIEPPRSGI